MFQEQIQYLPIEKILCNVQIREQFSDEAINGLAQSIKEVGLQQPLRVRQEGQQFIVLDGERRLRALKTLTGTRTVPVIVEEKELSEAEILQRQLISAVQRENLAPCERATALHRLIETSGWTAGEAAAKLGLSGATVSRSLALLSLPEAILKRVERGEIPASAAAELAGISDGKRQTELADQLAAGQLTRDGLVGVRRAARQSTSEPTATQPSRVTALLGESRSVTVADIGLTLERFIEVIEELLTKARRERTRGVELSTFIKVLRDQARGTVPAKR